MGLDELIKRLELLKSSPEVSGGDEVVIYHEGEKYEIKIEIDLDSSDIFLETGNEV